MPSQTEENYLKAIYTLNREKGLKASTNAIADRMETKASSVTDMLKKLKDKGLIHYQKYQAVQLTEEGENVAVSIIRKHRLWEYFLVEKLDFEWDKVHDIAEELEHIESNELTNRLDAFLNYPKMDPHGDPIPDENGNFPARPGTMLLQGEINQSYIVIGVKDHSSLFFNHLKSLEIELGTHLKILDINQFDQSMEISIGANEKGINISKQVANNLYVQVANNLYVKNYEN